MILRRIFSFSFGGDPLYGRLWPRLRDNVYYRRFRISRLCNRFCIGSCSSSSVQGERRKPDGDRRRKRSEEREGEGDTRFRQRCSELYFRPTCCNTSYAPCDPGFVILFQFYPCRFLTLLVFYISAGFIPLVKKIIFLGDK